MPKKKTKERKFRYFEFSAPYIPYYTEEPQVRLELDLTDLIDYYDYHDAPSGVSDHFNKESLTELRDLLNRILEEIGSLE